MIFKTILIYTAQLKKKIKLFVSVKHNNILLCVLNYFPQGSVFRPSVGNPSEN